VKLFIGNTNGAPGIRKVVFTIISVLLLSLMFVGGLRLYESITRRLPISRTSIQAALSGVTKNADWTPTIHHFDGLDFALVPSGCFSMGSTESQMEEALSACKTYGGENCPYVFDQIATRDAPVCFEKPYWINVTEVTNREYGSSSSTDMISMYRGPSWPRETVSWHEAITFCESIGARLPTEAEWEYAARGPDGLIYPWGNEMSASYREEAEMLNPDNVESIDIDTSWVGAQDMSGNVMEWVADVFDPASTPRAISPKAAQSPELRIVRGGSWASYQDFLLRTMQRVPYDTDFASSVVGFRCARDLEATP
jgi:iron(II)-dependent oxidoreductase